MSNLQEPVLPWDEYDEEGRYLEPEIRLFYLLHQPALICAGARGRRGVSGTDGPLRTEGAQVSSSTAPEATPPPSGSQQETQSKAASPTAEDDSRTEGGVQGPSLDIYIDHKPVSTALPGGDLCIPREVMEGLLSLLFPPHSSREEPQGTPSTRPLRLTIHQRAFGDDTGRIAHISFLPARRVPPAVLLEDLLSASGSTHEPAGKQIDRSDCLHLPRV